jgi:hypothetical protein
LRRTTSITLAVVTALVAVGAATGIGRGETEEVVASFQARAIGNPHIKSCRAIPGGTYSQLEASYRGSLTTDPGEALELTTRGLEVLVNRETGLGSVEGTWGLVVPGDPDVVGRGELIAVFVGNPHIFEGELHGMLIGGFEDPDERRVLWNFSARLTNGGQTMDGAVGNPNIAPNAAILIPSGPC